MGLSSLAWNLEPGTVQLSSRPGPDLAGAQQDQGMEGHHAQDRSRSPVVEEYTLCYQDIVGSKVVHLYSCGSKL